MRSLTGCTPWVANPPDPVKDKRLCRACGILDRASRACCWKDKSGLRRTIFIHAGVQLALAIFVHEKNAENLCEDADGTCFA